MVFVPVGRELIPFSRIRNCFYGTVFRYADTIAPQQSAWPAEDL